MKYFIGVVFLALLSHPARAQYDDRFYHPDKVMQKIEGVTSEKFFLNNDSAKLDGLMLKTKAKKPVATIMFFPGAGGNISTYVPMLKPFVDSGFQVYMVDYRGFGQSTGKPTHMHIAKDEQAAFNHMLKRKDVIGTKIILFGVSMGTQVATKIARDNQEKVAALVLESVVSSFTDIAADKTDKPEQKKYILENIKSPYSAAEDVQYIENMPKLFIHSLDDDDVPIKEAKKVYENALDPKWFWQVQAKHLETIIYFDVEYIARVKKLLTYNH